MDFITFKRFYFGTQFCGRSLCVRANRYVSAYIQILSWLLSSQIVCYELGCALFAVVMWLQKKKKNENEKSTIPFEFQTIRLKQNATEKRNEKCRMQTIEKMFEKYQVQNAWNTFFCLVFYFMHNTTKTTTAAVTVAVARQQNERHVVYT